MKKVLLLIGVCGAFAVGYGVTTKAYPAGGMYGRAESRGYFTNAYDTQGTFVLPKTFDGGTNAIPDSVNTASELIDFLRRSNGLQGNAQRRTGASFIIQTMIGSARNRPPTAAQLTEWESRVRYAESQGRISWFSNYSFCINTYWQGTNGGGADPNDDAFFDDCQTNESIIFRNASGAIVYVIKRTCANPVGNVSPIPDAPPPQNFEISGYSRVESNPNPLPGEQVHFRHFIRNNGPTSSAPTDIWWITLNSATGTPIAGPTNSGDFPANTTREVAEEFYTVPANTPPGTTICRQVGWDPINESGGRNGRGAPVCATVRYDFALTPIINFTVNGAAPAGSVAEQGDTIQFTYSVRNNGLTQSQTTSCNIYAIVRTGSYTAPTPPDSASSPGGYVPPGTGCPRTFPANTTTTLNSPPESITATTANQTICRALWVNPASHTGGSQGTEVCIRIVAKPYLKVYGGDVMAGSGLETAPDTCTNNTNAAIISWNKRAAGTYAGAGVQHAASALRSITDFGTGRGNSVGATTPSWLSFGNTAVNFGAGNFGGNLGSVPCIPDYYSGRPDTTLAIPANVTAMTSGNYGGSGTITLAGGNVNPGENTTVYVDGNVFISSNIIYTPNWTYQNVPLFRLVVRGNIFVGSGVTRLDGVFIAQRNGASGGTIYTCATAAAAPTLTNGAFFNSCNSKLTVNGAFMANSVEFLRTSGSLSQSNPSEASAASTAGEVFNFNPSLWMTQPLPTGETPTTYDAITSLPPVL